MGTYLFVEDSAQLFPFSYKLRKAVLASIYSSLHQLNNPIQTPDSDYYLSWYNQGTVQQ